jgi:hypothetical protein
MPRASKRASVPTQGDFYPTVRSWCARLGVTALDVRANEVFLTEVECRIYIAAVMGKRFPVRVRVLHGSVGRGGERYIVLDRSTINAYQMSLGTVLHEVAHAVQLTRAKQRRDIRRELRLQGKRTPPLPKRRDMHGEAFCRTYARLLRDCLT